MIFIGDTVPLTNDFLIIVNKEQLLNSLNILNNINECNIFYPAWDSPYSLNILKSKINDAINKIKELEKIVLELDNNTDLNELVNQVYDKLKIGVLNKNPLFKTTINALRKKG